MRLPDHIFQSLKTLDSCTAANAIEYFHSQLRNEGFANTTSVHCHFPELPPMLGYAMTMKVRGANPPMRGGVYLERTDWWKSLERQPGPHVLVIQDVDRVPGTGAFVGEVHAAILSAMGCVGAVTNGAVRGLPAVERMGFNLFSGTVSPSHAYIHVVEFGGLVEVAGIKIRLGDLLLGDRHGIVRIPLDMAPELPAVAERIRNTEREIVDFCNSDSFTREGLEELLKRREHP